MAVPTHAASSRPQGGPLPAGTVIHATSCLQPPPQSVKDRATYTPQELQAYGLPPRGPTEPFSRWAQVVRSATVRFCDRTVSSAHIKPVYTAGDLYSQNWVGWEANQGHSSINYSETDVDYYEPCPDNSQDSEEAMWAGLGGETTQYLVQTGTIVHRYWTGSNWYNDHEAYVENVGDTGNPAANKVFAVRCNDHMYAKVWGGDCMFVEDLNTGHNSGDQCYGPNADGLTAEEMGERPQDNYYFTGIAPLADFHTVTFYGVGVTANGNYISMGSAISDYTNMWSSDYSHKLASVGGIQNDPGDPPYDQYSVTWLAIS